MKTSLVSIIAAIDEKRGIGKENKIPWDIPADRKWFKKKTMGHVVIMGRNTYLSIVNVLGKPLPGRINIVVTNVPSSPVEDVYFVGSIADALDLAKKLEKNGEVFFIGGESIYKQSIDLADKLYLTLIKGEFNCDTFFPDYSIFKKDVYSKKEKDDKYRYEFKILER